MTFWRLHLNRISTTECIQADITVTHLWKKRGWTACRRPRPNLSILKKLTRSIVSFIFRILWNIRIWWSDKNKNWHRWLVHTDYLRARNWFDSKKGKQLWQGKGWKQVFFKRTELFVFKKITKTEQNFFFHLSGDFLTSDWCHLCYQIINCYIFNIIFLDLLWNIFVRLVRDKGLETFTNWFHFSCPARFIQSLSKELFQLVNFTRIL